MIAPSPVQSWPHLRDILEIQPVVLTRVALDGTFLAVNEAGLSMLGAQSLEDILGTSLLALVSDDDRDNCKALLKRAATARGSVQIDLVSLNGTRRTAELHARAHPGAPDGGAPSVLITFHDLTESRRLEDALMQALARQAEQETYYETERARLLADLERAREVHPDRDASPEQILEFERRLSAAEEERARLASAHAAEVERLNASAAERDAAAHSQLMDLERRYETLDGERQHLLETTERLRGDADGRQATLNQLVEQLDIVNGERQQARDSAASLQLVLNEREAAMAKMTSRLALLDADYARVTESSAQLQHDLDASTRKGLELAARVDTLERQQSELRTAADDTAAESQQLRVRYAADTGALRSALDESIAEQAQLARAVAAGEEAAVQSEARIAVLEARLAEERAAFDACLAHVYESHAAGLQELQAQHAVRLRELQEGHDARLAQLETDHVDALDRLKGDHAAACAELETLLLDARARAADALAERDRATADAVADRKRLGDELLAAAESERSVRAALAAEAATRVATERVHSQFVAAIGSLVKAAGGAPDVAPVATGVSAASLAGLLRAELPRRLGDRIELSMCLDSPDARTAIDGAVIVDAIVAVMEADGLAMAARRIAVEIAEVGIVGGSEGSQLVAPEDYILVCATVEGRERNTMPDGPATDSRSEARDAAEEARSALVAGGGQIRISRDDGAVLVVEVYLPRSNGGVC